MDSVFIYWDNSNIFHEAQRLAEEREEGPNARYLVRVNFDNMFAPSPRRPYRQTRRRARLGAPGDAPALEPTGGHGCENQVVQQWRARADAHAVLANKEMEDALDNNGDPGIAVVLTGDGAGYLEGTGFHSTLERMHKRNWRVEILSWAHSCNQRMRQWAEDNGVFVALDDFYDSVTYVEPSRPGFELSQGRGSVPLDLSRRSTT